jgi:hypothetical protein
MELEQLTTQVRAGMHVIAADGKKLGKVRRMHVRDTEVSVEVPFPWALWSPLKPHVRFLPGSMVAQIAGQEIHLNVAAPIANSCTSMPEWIKQQLESATPGAPGAPY